jgi:hypothetical protein
MPPCGGAEHDAPADDGFHDGPFANHGCAFGEADTDDIVDTLLIDAAFLSCNQAHTSAMGSPHRIRARAS